MTTTNPRKGDAVVLEQTHSSHDLKMKKTVWTTYQIALAEAVDKRGLVTKIRLPGGVRQGVPADGRILTVQDEMHQEGARRLLTRVTPAENSWPDSDTIKKAIIEAFAWDRVF